MSMSKSSSRKILQGDRISHFGGEKGTITRLDKGLLKYQITWDSGKTESYTQKEFSKWCEVLPPEPEAEDIEEEELSLFGADFSREQWKVGDRISIKGRWGKIVQDSYSKCWPYEIAWDAGGRTVHAEKEFDQCSDNLTYAQESESGSHSPVSNLEPSTLPDSVNGTNIANQSSNLDTQIYQSTQTLKLELVMAGANVKEISTSLQLHHPVSPSQSKANDSEPMMSETASQQSLERSHKSSPDTLRSKTCEDCSPALTNPEQKPSISLLSSEAFTPAGTMSNGSWSAAGILPAPSLEKGCSWLESPGALSSHTSRAPGQNRLESQLKANGLLEKGECLNPHFLEQAYQLPLNWTNPTELRTAAQLLADAEKPSETASIHESQRSPSGESSTSTASPTDSGLVISFGKTYPQLLNGKSVTRRIWKFSHAQKFIRAYQKGLRVQALDKDQRYGGKQIGWLTLLEEPYEQPLYNMPIGDLAAEGFPELAPFEFIERFFEGKPETIVWVVRFKFEPLEKTEEELTPVNDGAIGKHYWCDRLDVVVEVLKIRNWRKFIRSPLIKGADVRPWWTMNNGKIVFPNTMVLALTDLEEIEEFSCPLPQQSNDSLEKSETQTSKQTGSLYQYTANRTGKDGIRREYPIIEGRDRDRAEDDDWYWGISYVVPRQTKSSDKTTKKEWLDRSASIPRNSLSLARAMMRAGFPVATTIEACQLKFCWLDFRGSWAIGEVRPEVSPRLAIISFDEKQVLIIPSSQWGELRVEPRTAKRRVINEAIASSKPFSYIKEILNAGA